MRIRVDLIEKRSFYAEIADYDERPPGLMYGSRMLRHSGRERKAEALGPIAEVYKEIVWHPVRDDFRASPTFETPGAATDHSERLPK